MRCLSLPNEYSPESIKLDRFEWNSSFFFSLHSLSIIFPRGSSAFFSNLFIFLFSRSDGNWINKREEVEFFLEMTTVTNVQ